MKRQLLLIVITLIVGMSVGWLAAGQQSQMKKWKKGKGAADSGASNVGFRTVKSAL